MPLDNFFRLLVDFLGSGLVGRGGLVSGSGSIGGGSVTVSLLGLRGVDGGSLECDISDESVVVVSGVGGGLDSAVGQEQSRSFRQRYHWHLVSVSVFLKLALL